MKYEEFKKEFEKSPYWAKGAIIGSLISLIIIFLTIIIYLYSIGFCKLQINAFCSLLEITIKKIIPYALLIPFGPVISTLNLILSKIELPNAFIWAIILLGYLICWFLLGALIGLISSKLKNKQKP